MAKVRNQYPRIACVVPFCRRGATCYPPGFEIICQRHYRAVDAALKAKRRRVRAGLKRRGEGQSDRARRLEAWLWGKMVEQAITRAGGLPL